MIITCDKCDNKGNFAMCQLADCPLMNMWWVAEFKKTIRAYDQTRCASIIDKQIESVRNQNSYRGNVNQTASFAIEQLGRVQRLIMAGGE